MLLNQETGRQVSFTVWPCVVEALSANVLLCTGHVDLKDALDGLNVGIEKKVLTSQNNLV
jgi:hypothetical protein